MKLNNWTKAALAMASMAVLATSCKKDDEKDKMTVRSATAGGVNLLGASPTGVPVGSTIKVLMSKTPNATTVNSTTVMLMNGTAAVASAITTSKDTIVLDPIASLVTGTNFTLKLTGGIKASDGAAFDERNITFKTEGPAPVVPPQNSAQLAYFNFNNNILDDAGSNDGATQIGLTYDTDRFGIANSCAKFNGTTSIVEVPNGTALITPSNTMSVWVKVDTTAGHGHFLMGANFFRGAQMEIATKGEWIKHGANFVYGGDSTTTEDLFYNGDGMFNTNGGWQGHTFRGTENLKQRLPDKWVHAVQTYDAASKKRVMYLNGQRVMESDFNLWPTGDSKRRVTGMRSQTGPDLSTTFAFGFAKGRDASFWSDTDFGDYGKPGANHFKGWLDDARFFNVALSATEVTQLYNAERP